MIPYGRQTIDDDDIQAVCDVLRSDYLTTGPKIGEFEQAVADYVNTKYAIAVSNGTAALHCAMYAIGIGPGDEVILPPMSFAATGNCICFQGGTPIFVDVDPGTLLIDPNEVEKKISKKTKAIIGVDYTGQPCDWDKLREIARKYNLYLVADGCHALGAEYKGKKVGSLADMTVFSFHPVKHIATGEGGMITTDSHELAQKLKLFRSHGITTDPTERERTGDWYYEMVDLGFNYRITDIQCALGLSQLTKLSDFLKRRREIASYYDSVFTTEGLIPLSVKADCHHAYHLYVVRILDKAGVNRNTVFKMLRKRGIGVNIHYIPIHLQPYYQTKFKYGPGLFPMTESAYEQIISLPIWPGMSDAQMHKVTEEVIECIQCTNV